MRDFAICFNGQVRQLYKGFEDFQILTKDIEYDVFAHIWEMDELLSGWGHNMGWEFKKTQFQSPKEFIDTYKPTKCSVENYKETNFYKENLNNGGYGNPMNKIYSSLSQYYSLKKSFETLNSYISETGNTYKYVLRCRPDMDIDFNVSKIDWNNIKERLDKNPNIVLTNPGWDWPNGDGCADFFAIGTLENMTKYSLLFDNYINIYNINPNRNYNESNMKFHLEKICGLKVEHCDINVGMYR